MVATRVGMSRNVLARASHQSLQILRWQLCCIGALALVCGLIFGLRAGASILAGGGIGLLWTLYMAATLFKHARSHGASLSAVSVFGGWMLKVALTLCLLVIAFRSKVLIPPAVLAGLFGAMVAYWGWLAFRGAADGK
jgi:F0F1-type ATP synthase assembly protein I